MLNSTQSRFNLLLSNNGFRFELLCAQANSHHSFNSFDMNSSHYIYQIKCNKIFNLLRKEYALKIISRLFDYQKLLSECTESFCRILCGCLLCYDGHIILKFWLLLAKNISKFRLSAATPQAEWYNYTLVLLGISIWESGIWMLLYLLPFNNLVTK